MYQQIREAAEMLQAFEQGEGFIPAKPLADALRNLLQALAQEDGNAEAIVNEYLPHLAPIIEENVESGLTGKYVDLESLEEPSPEQKLADMLGVPLPRKLVQVCVSHSYTVYADDLAMLTKAREALYEDLMSAYKNDGLKGMITSEDRPGLSESDVPSFLDKPRLDEAKAALREATGVDGFDFDDNQKIDNIMDSLAERYNLDDEGRDGLHDLLCELADQP